MVTARRTGPWRREWKWHGLVPRCRRRRGRGRCAGPPGPAWPAPGAGGYGGKAPRAPTRAGEGAPPARPPAHPRALSAAEGAAVLGALHSPRFRDRAPAEVFATLLDDGVYLA